VSGPGLTFGSRIVDRDIEAPEPRDRPVNKVADFFVLAHIGTDEFGLSAGIAKLGGKGSASLVMTTRDDNLSAAAGKSKCGGPADTGQGASNQNNGGFHGTILFGSTR
jgi:hypothetical protein